MIVINMSDKTISIRAIFNSLLLLMQLSLFFIKTIYNTKLAFNPQTTEFFELFCSRMLAFLFAIIYCGINEYQSGNKVLRLIDEKIA